MEGLTVSAGWTGSGKLTRPRTTEGCHKDVWESRGGRIQSKSHSLCENGTIFWTFIFLKPQTCIWRIYKVKL